MNTAAAADDPRDHTNELLEDVLGEVAADWDFLDQLRGRRDEVLDVAESFDGVEGRFVSGSVAHGTANGTTDADCGVELGSAHYPNLGPEGDGPKDVVEAMRAHLRENLKEDHPDIAFRVTKRAITVTYNESLPDGTDPTVDLIVGLERTQGGLWIPNTKRPGWDPSHPRKHTELLNEGSKALRVVRARAIRLAKAWNTQYSDPGLSSFNLEALALGCVTSDMDVAEALAELFDFGAKELEKHLTPDPAEASGPIKLLTDRDAVVKRLRKAANGMQEAIDHSDDEEKACLALSSVFWEYIEAPEGESKERFAAEARKGNRGFGITAGVVGVAGAAAVARKLQKNPRAYGDEQPR